MTKQRTAEQRDAVSILLQKEIEALSTQELNLVMAHLVFTDVREDAERRASVMVDGKWVCYSPMTNGNDLLAIFNKVDIVASSHVEEREGKSWYSAHAYLSGTEFYSKESFAEAACMAGAALLKHKLRYSDPGMEWSAAPAVNTPSIKP